MAITDHAVHSAWSEEISIYLFGHYHFFTSDCPGSEIQATGIILSTHQFGYIRFRITDSADSEFLHEDTDNIR